MHGGCCVSMVSMGMGGLRQGRVLFSMGGMRERWVKLDQCILNGDLAVVFGCLDHGSRTGKLWLLWGVLGLGVLTPSPMKSWRFFYSHFNASLKH